MARNHRIWQRIDQGGGPDACWPCLLYRDPKGYCRTKVCGRPIKVHRLVWELVHGPIPPGFHVLHRCDNPPCCNPTHLFLGTHADNMADMMEKGRNRYAVHHGEKHGRAKLTRSQVIEIRRRRANGETQTSLGQAFGVTQGTIWKILSGRHWKDTGGASG